MAKNSKYKKASVPPSEPPPRWDAKFVKALGVWSTALGALAAAAWGGFKAGSIYKENEKNLQIYDLKEHHREITDSLKKQKEGQTIELKQLKSKDKDENKQK